MGAQIKMNQWKISSLPVWEVIAYYCIGKDPYLNSYVIS